MTKPAPTNPPAEQLAGFRHRIDALDEQIAQLLLERSGVVREVAALKQENWPAACHIRPGREGQMHEHIAQRFAGTDVLPAAALAIWRQMIGAATQLESPLNATFLAHETHHAWLAREYFGVAAGVLPEASLADMLDTMAQGKANLLLLPAAESGDWWRDAPLFTKHGLSIFASLPVTDAPLPFGAQPALALAAVTPEPTGNDTSYLALTTSRPVNPVDISAALPCRVVSVDATHHLLVVDGFVTEFWPELASLRGALGAALLSLIPLGAHPKPVRL